MDLSEFRKDYIKGGLHRDELAETPLEQFTRWFEQAIDSGMTEPNAMSLATVAANGLPSLRTVLLKYFDQQGMVFFTNYTSRKAKEITANPNVSLLFPWIDLERQVIILGRAEKISSAESLNYFQSRPHESQLGAWVSNQSSIIHDRSELTQKLAELEQKFEVGKVPLPDFWGGYRVIPLQVEFWQGGPARLHDRLVYRRDNYDSEWKIVRLSP